MNEIIINNFNGNLTVSSLQVANDIGKQHKHVIEIIEKLKAENSALTKMFIEATYIAGTGKPYKCYELTRDGFSLLVMGFTGKKSLEWKLKYIEAFNFMESKLQIQQDSYMIDDPIKRAERWIEERKKYIALEQKIEQDKPLVRFAEQVNKADELIDVGAFAKLLHKENISMGRNALFQWLRDNKYLRQNNEPYQKWINSGVFKTKEFAFYVGDRTRLKIKTLITPQGQIYLAKKIMDWT